MKIVALDIETSPILAYTFSLFKPVIGHKQIVNDPRIICFSWQWVGEKKVNFMSEHHDGRQAMLEKLHEILNGAHAVIHYNGSSFDMPWINGELLAEGFTPPPPVKNIDLFQAIKSATRFPSKKLDYVADRILDQKKVSHSGIELWIDCLAGDEKAWRLMKRYAVQDTRLLIPLYLKLRPWIKNHPNVNLYDGRSELACTRCGSYNYQSRGFARTSASVFRRFQCNDCGGWFRFRARDASTDSRNAV